MKIYKLPCDGDLKEIKIEVTRDCPLACIHCSSNAGVGNTSQLSLEVVLSLIAQAGEMGVESIIFSGGEPLVWPWLYEAVNECVNHGMRCSIYSTGIGQKDRHHSIEFLAEHGLKRVVFSLYSPHKELHEQVTRTANSFDMTASEIANTTGINIEREIHFVPFKRNYNQLEEVVKFAAVNKISKVSILRFVPHGRGAIFKDTQEMLSRQECLELRDAILDCRRNYDVKIRTGSPFNILLLETDVYCDAAWHTLVIGPNCNIYPCDAFKNIEPMDIGLDDVYNNVEHKLLKDCWYKSSYLNAIRQYLSTPFAEPCNSCVHLERCKSGCLAQKVIQQESILDGNIAKQPDPLCLKRLIGGLNATS